MRKICCNSRPSRTSPSPGRVKIWNSYKIMNKKLEYILSARLTHRQCYVPVMGIATAVEWLIPPHPIPPPHPIAIIPHHTYWHTYFAADIHIHIQSHTHTHVHIYEYYRTPNTQHALQRDFSDECIILPLDQWLVKTYCF